jgi:hypothetical protein
MSAAKVARCFKDLADAMKQLPNSFFHVEENGVL